MARSFEPRRNYIRLTVWFFSVGPLPFPSVRGSAKTIAKLGVGRVRSIAERFVLGSAAAAQRHAIADFVGLTIGADERDAPAHPKRTAALLRRILD